MKNYFNIIFLFFVFISAASANQRLTVPFENIQLNPGGVITANYTIGIHKLIFCFENTTQNIGIIVWPYLGQSQSSFLPVFLKTDPQMEGSLADNSGILGIRNNQSFALFVSCLFGY